MEYKIETPGEISVIGIEARTSNTTAQNDIPKLWQKFYSESINEKIPNKVSEEILSLYTDYEGDYTKPYTVVLGCKVKSIDSIPEGMVAKKIPSSDYAVFIAKGKMPDKLIETWMFVWTSDLDRAYTTDFDLHEGNEQTENALVKVYVAIK